MNVVFQNNFHLKLTICRTVMLLKDERKKTENRKILLFTLLGEISTTTMGLLCKLSRELLDVYIFKTWVQILEGSQVLVREESKNSKGNLVLINIAQFEVQKSQTFDHSVWEGIDKTASIKLWFAGDESLKHRIEFIVEEKRLKERRVFLYEIKHYYIIELRQPYLNVIVKSLVLYCIKK